MVLCSFPLSQQGFKQGICINFSYVFGHLSPSKEKQALKISDGYDKYLKAAGLENRTSADYRTLTGPSSGPTSARLRKNAAPIEGALSGGKAQVFA